VKTAAADAAAAEETKAKAKLKEVMDKAKGAETDDTKAATVALQKASDAAAVAEVEKKKSALEAATQAAELANLESLRKDLDRATAIAATAGGFAAVSTGAGGPSDSPAFIKAAESIQAIVTTIVDHDYSKETCMDAITSRSARSLKTEQDVDLLELQMNYCAYAIRDKAANASRVGSNSRPLTAEALAQIAQSAERFTESAGKILQNRRSAIAQAAAKPASAPEPKK
jgi:hypothetical protein